ncbi:RHS repeat protein [Achromobacter sp. K91]|uniref:RHS repeat-associated core domain-containing protein n=1 Tax=Achromobacter sp. K91 TaxID=2292262 RepID=UPI000E66784E|nr:RHS repeat-associated core domain-containing protein [Achromobacter sp. K91]RIJ00636.1 RHS repeat protein [Achromobacter sp. K91]
MGNLYVGTPKITVRDNRGQTVRTLRYNRSRASDATTQYVDAQVYNDLGQLTSSQDARFFGTGISNFEYAPALSGQVLQTISADAGTSQTFADIEGRQVWRQDARSTTQTYAFDALGRPRSRAETLDSQSAEVRERWVYGDLAPPPSTYEATDKTDPRNLNQRGQVVQHYDTAGLLDTGAIGYALQGAAQQQVRRLLPPETPSDWTIGTGADWQAKLAQGDYPTAWAYNAFGQVLEQTDARGHRQRSAYDVTGRKSAGWVTPNGAGEQSVTTATTYAAGGEIETKADANGITTVYTYEPQNTQRVLEIKVTRQGAPTTVLQDLNYTYDPVGNVVGMTDNAAQIAYFNNQAITRSRAYIYDALYQLLSGSGRENTVSSIPRNTDNPGVSAPPTPNPVNYRNYSRSYTYDLGGNLTGITPGNGASIRSMTVAAASNRAVSNLNATSVTAATVENYFDAAGNANCLDGNTNQPMYWSGLNQLQHLVTIQRNAADPAQGDDRESYAYGGDGRRVRKTGYSWTGSIWNQADAIYLPGLEIRSRSAGEQLEVIVLDDGARVLNWTDNKPDDIANQQIRYRYGDRQDSCQIETDQTGAIITQEEYYPYGGTAVWAATTQSEAKYKTIRYSGKERDAAGLYYYGFRYYQPWIGRWISPDPAGTVDGQNLYCMVGNDPVMRQDLAGLMGADNDDEPEKKRAKLAHVPGHVSPGSSTGVRIASVDSDVAEMLTHLSGLPFFEFEEKKDERSQSALDRQVKIIGATPDEIDARGYEFDETKRGSYQSSELSDAIGRYTFNSGVVNRYLRSGPEEGATLDEISQTKSLAMKLQTALETLPGESTDEPSVKIYRAVTTDTPDQYPHSGLEVGDILITRDFISFTESPHSLLDFSEVDVRGKIRNTTAYFIAAYAPSAKPISPFAEDGGLEAERLVPIGVAFQVESIGKIDHDGHEFTQIIVGEVSGFSISDGRSQSGLESTSSLNGKRALKIGTGEPYDMNEVRSRLGSGSDRILRRYAPS